MTERQKKTHDDLPARYYILESKFFVAGVSRCNSAIFLGMRFCDIFWDVISWYFWGYNFAIFCKVRYFVGRNLAIFLGMRFCNLSWNAILQYFSGRNFAIFLRTWYCDIPCNAILQYFSGRDFAIYSWDAILQYSPLSEFCDIWSCSRNICHWNRTWCGTSFYWIEVFGSNGIWCKVSIEFCKFFSALQEWHPVLKTMRSAKNRNQQATELEVKNIDERRSVELAEASDTLQHQCWLVKNQIRCFGISN